MPPSAPLVLTTLPPPALMAHAELKRDNAILEILPFLGFTRIPGATVYGCRGCLDHKTACHVLLPEVRVHGPQPLNEHQDDRDQAGIFLAPWFMDVQCSLDRPIAMFMNFSDTTTWNMHSKHRFEACREWLVNNDEGDRARFSQYLHWVDFPQAICGALWDIVEVTKRLEAVKRRVLTDGCG